MNLTFSLVLGCLLFGSYSSGAPARESQQDSRTAEVPRKGDTPGPTDARELLNESYLSGAGLFPAERVFQLAYLARTAALVGEPKTVTWADEGLALAEKLPVSWNRLALEKNFLISIAGQVPEKALEQLCLLSPPVPLDDGSLPEDVRADSAKAIFKGYWTKVGLPGLEEIQHVSYCLGDTGQFPFAALAPIVTDLAKRDSDDAISLFMSALGYIKRRPEIEAGDEEVVTMLLNLRGTVPDWALVYGLRYAVERLSQELPAPAGGSQSRVTFTALAYSKQGSQKFASRKEMLLARLLPEIRRLDPSLAATVLKEHPVLSMGTGAEIDRVESVFVHGSADAETVSQLQLQGLENERLSAVQQLAATDPSAALTLAKTISTPSVRSQAISAVAGRMEGSDPAMASRLAGEVGNDLKSIADVPDRIEASASAINAAAKVGDPATVENLLRSAFKLGTDYWQQELDLKPGQAASLCRVFGPLTALVRLGSQIDPSWTVDAVRKLEPLQRSYLLVFAAEGVHSIPAEVPAR